MKYQKSYSDKNVRAKKHLGQHFLKDENIAYKIAEELEYNAGSTVVEIGPGTGVLSKYITEKVDKIGFDYKLIELDSESVDYLQSQNIYQKSGIEIINRSILKIDWSDFGNQIELIGNLPYNISSPIFFKAFESFEHIYKGVFMVQKEVAHRICSQHGNKSYGILSVLLQSLFKCELLFDVHPNSFIPPPKVTSSVFSITKKEEAVEPGILPILKSIVKKSFNNRRKMLRNTLSNELQVLGEEFEKYLTLRPEQLSVPDFLYLAKAISEKKDAV